MACVRSATSNRTAPPAYTYINTDQAFQESTGRNHRLKHKAGSVIRCPWHTATRFGTLFPVYNSLGTLSYFEKLSHGDCKLTLRVCTKEGRKNSYSTLLKVGR